jgi:hypothetical protein
MSLARISKPDGCQDLYNIPAHNSTAVKSARIAKSGRQLLQAGWSWHTNIHTPRRGEPRVKKITRIGIGGPIDSGKTPIVEAITPRLIAMGAKILVITHDVVNTTQGYECASTATVDDMATFARCAASLHQST